MKINTKINYFPYKVFQRNTQIYNNNNHNNRLNKGYFKSYEFPLKYKKSIIDISKNLKSVAISNKLFTNYMDNYNNLTKDYCFKSPENDVYPIRKNSKFLSTGVKTNYSYQKDKKLLLLKRPISVNFSKFKFIEGANQNSQRNIKSAINKKNEIPFCINGDICFNSQVATRVKNFNFKIDLDNDKKTKRNHFEYLKKYINTNINNLGDNFDKGKLSHTSFLSKGQVQYKLNIYSICLKFRIINNDNTTTKPKIQKLYINFKYLPIFYLVNFDVFKVFLSEIIYYDFALNNFVINNTGLDNVCKKYFGFIKKQINDSNININEITYYKNEFFFPSYYKWFVYEKENDDKSSNNNEDKCEKNKDQKKAFLFELKIELPKIKFKIINYDIRIRNNLNKSLIIQLLKSGFYKWESLIFTELYFIKKFRYIINSILINKNKYFKQKINLGAIDKDLSNTSFCNSNKILKLKNTFEFFITEINEKFSTFYIFNPYIITLNKHKNNYHSDIKLTLKESRILFKFSKHWGIVNTLLKCINFNSDIHKNKIEFKFDLLENIPVDYFKGNEIINKIKEKKDQMRFKFNSVEIIVSECLLQNLIVKKDGKRHDKFFRVPPKFLKFVFKNKEKYFFQENKIKEYCQEIREEKEIEIKRLSSKKNTDLFLEEFLIEKKKSLQKSKKSIEKVQKLSKINERNSSNLINYLNDSANVKPFTIMDSFSETKWNETNFDNKNNISKISATRDSNKITNEETVSQFKESILSRYISKTSFTNNTIKLIRNKRELEKSRTIRDNNSLLNSEISINELRDTIMGLMQKTEESVKK